MLFRSDHTLLHCHEIEQILKQRRAVVRFAVAVVYVFFS
jgi:hypothetical protein